MITTNWRTSRSAAVILILAVLLIHPIPVAAQGVRGSGMKSAQPGISWWADPNQGRLFLTPTARTIPKGHINITLIELIMPFVAVGVTDEFTVSAGTPLLTGGALQEWWITGKYRIRSGPKTNTAIAAMTIFGQDEIGGAFYAIVTAGSPDASVTAGLGLAYFGDDLAKSGAFTIGGDYRLGGGNTKLITEHHFLPSSDPISSLGVRFIGDHINVELGLGVVWAKRNPDISAVFDLSGIFPVIIIALGL